MRWPRVVTYAIRATALCLALTACAPNPAQVNNAGNAALRQGQPATAVHHLHLAQVLAPDAPQAYYNAASAYSELGELERALEMLDQALRTDDPDLIYKARFNLGNIYYLMERYHDAVAVFRELLTLNPDDQDARYNMELALLLAAPPTPESQQQLTEPEDAQTDPDTTPTPDPNAPDGPTPTPPLEDTPPDLTATPEGGTGDFRGREESTLVPQFGGRMPLEDVERLLELVEQDQRSFSEFLRQIIDSGEPVQNDW